ncbi:hypothetical protein M1D88_19055 [Arthrobacter sp. R1-13]
MSGMLAVAVHHVIIVPAVCLMTVEAMSRGAFSDVVAMTVIVVLMPTVVVMMMAPCSGRGGSGSP